MSILGQIYYDSMKESYEKWLLEHQEILKKSKELAEQGIVLGPKSIGGSSNE